MPAFEDVKRMLSTQVFGKPHLPPGDFAGKTIIITGANTGVGFEAAKHIARLRAEHIILGCRDIRKGQEAVRVIKESTEFEGNLEVWQLDLADYKSVLSFSQRVQAELPRLDGFIANAGLELQEFQLAEGLEMQLTVNVVSTILCAIAILPKLKDTSRKFGTQTNLTFQGSAYHIFGPDQELDVANDANTDILESLSNPQSADMTGRYALSKLMMHQCVHELAKCVPSSDVIVNTTHPGWAATELSRAKKSKPLGERVGFALIGWTAEKGSRSCVYAVQAGKETHGCYLSEGIPTPESAFMRSERAEGIQKRVWRDLMSRIQQISPDIAAFI